jgi:hydroxyacylglutathione hydrolase
MSVEPQNQDLIQKVQQVRKLRESQLPTIPCRLGDEKKTNPFLRVDFSSEIRKNIMVQDGTINFV